MEVHIQIFALPHGTPILTYVFVSRRSAGK